MRHVTVMAEPLLSKVCWLVVLSKPYSRCRSHLAKSCQLRSLSFDGTLPVSRMKNESGPMLDAGLSGLIGDPRMECSMTPLLLPSANLPQPARGVSTSGNSIVMTDVTTGHTVILLLLRVPEQRGFVYGESDKTVHHYGIRYTQQKCWQRCTTALGLTRIRSFTTT